MCKRLVGMTCCDSYQQRESVDVAMTDGDRRIGAILMVLGPELLRRLDNECMSKIIGLVSRFGATEY